MRPSRRRCGGPASRIAPGWLNPEPVASWDTGDSLMSKYAAFTQETFECRNLDQLEQFVERCC
jgi:hypothetical protein